MAFASDRRRVRRGARPSRRAFLLAAFIGASVAIARVSAADAESADASRDSDSTRAEDVESYDPTQHIEFGTEQAPQEWVRTSEDGMPIVPFEIIDVAASLAEKEGSAAGETKDKTKRQDYQDLAALLHSQAATIDSFHGREDLHPDGACAAEIKSLCPPEEMEETHVSNLKFTNVGGETIKTSEDEDEDEETAPGAVTERRARFSRRALLAELTPDQKEALEHLTADDPWGVDEDPTDDTSELSEKDRRIFDLEKKVNALAELIDTTKRGTASGKPMASAAFRERAHRPYKSYFECVHSNIVEVHKKRAKHVVTPECRAEVRESYARRFADIRKDAELVEACGGGHKREKADVEFLPDPDDDDDRSNNAARGEAIAGGDIGKFCADVKPGLGLVFRCLKAHKAELDPACAKVVGFRQIEQAADISLDTPLALSCEEDRKSLCADAPWGGGAVEQCLKDNRSELSTQCKLEVFRREVEESEDVRYDAFLAETCAADKSAFCGDVVPGEGRIMACLEAHAGAAKFSAECRSILDRRVVRRAADWRLDFALRKACAKTAKSMCAPELEAARSKVSSSGTVLECLKRKHADGDVDDAPCAAEIKKKMVAAAGDIREDTALTLACKAELTKHCDGVAPGEGRLWRCLAEHRADASDVCEAKLFEREVWMSGDWRFKYALANECSSEAQTLCQGVAAGGGRVIRCLQSKLGDPAMGASCRKAVFADQKREHSDVRLHKELSQACGEDTKELCGDVEPGEGRVLACLKKRRASLKEPECRHAVLRLMMSHADNYLLDAPLAAACHDDVIAHCSAVEPGHGRVHECLRAIPNALSKACLAAEVAAEADEAEDIRLKPQITRACAASAAALCGGVEPGQAQSAGVPAGQGFAPRDGHRVLFEADAVRRAREPPHGVQHHGQEVLPRGGGAAVFRRRRRRRRDAFDEGRRRRRRRRRGGRRGVGAGRRESRPVNVFGRQGGRHRIDGVLQRRAPQRCPRVQGVPRRHSGHLRVRRRRRAPVRRDAKDARLHGARLGFVVPAAQRQRRGRRVLERRRGDAGGWRRSYNRHVRDGHAAPGRPGGHHRQQGARDGAGGGERRRRDARRRRRRGGGARGDGAPEKSGRAGHGFEPGGVRARGRGGRGVPRAEAHVLAPRANRRRGESRGTQESRRAQRVTASRGFDFHLKENVFLVRSLLQR
jgi:hypothetical protein